MGKKLLNKYSAFESLNVEVSITIGICMEQLDQKSQ